MKLTQEEVFEVVDKYYEATEPSLSISAKKLVPNHVTGEFVGLDIEGTKMLGEDPLPFSKTVSPSKFKQMLAYVLDNDLLQTTLTIAPAKEAVISDPAVSPVHQADSHLEHLYVGPRSRQ